MAPLSDLQRQQTLVSIDDLYAVVHQAELASAADNDGVTTTKVFHAAEALRSAIDRFRTAVDANFEWDEDRRSAA